MFAARAPLVDMRIMRRRGVWTNLAAALLGSGMYSGFVLIPQFAETPVSDGFGFGSSVTGAGLLTLMMLVTGAAAGRLELRFGSRVALVAGGQPHAAGFTEAFAIIAGLLALATLAALAIPRRDPRGREPELALEPAAA